MKKGLLLILIICFVGLCAYLFIAFNNEAEKTAIRQLNEEQKIYAKQASQGIADFFKTWIGILNSFSKIDAIIKADADGKQYMNLFYEAHHEQISSITRVDERGRIMHTVPHVFAIGSDISAQKHIRKILQDHKPVVSDVFRTVQGFEAIALHVPVFSGVTFKGTIAIVIDFKSLARSYLEVIRIGKTGYAWVVSSDGTILYSPVPGFTGKSVFDVGRDFPSIISMAKDMKQGHEGNATYIFDKIGDQTVAPVRKYAVYMPIHIADSFWSVVVASSEDEVLSALASFRNRLVLVIGIILFGGVLFSIIGAKAWIIVAEEEKRKRTEAELQKASQKREELELIINKSPAVVFLWRAAAGWPVEYVSENVRKWGYTPEDFMSGRVAYADVVHKDDLERVGAEVAARSASGVTEFTQEYRVITKSGDILWTDDTTWIRRDQNGTITHYQGIVLDITESKKAEETLQRNEKVLWLFVEHSPAAIAMFDRDMKYIVASRRFLMDYNLGDQNVIGRSHYEVFPEITDRWKEIHRRCLAGAVEKSDEDLFPRADGKMDWVRWEIRPWYETQGKIGGIILFSEVITERKNAEQELEKHRAHLEQMVLERTGELLNSQRALVNIVEDLNEKTRELEAANDKLQELDRLKSMFIASMSHELRTPLNSIIGFSSILQNEWIGPVNEEQKENLKTILRAGKHLLNLINDVIDVSKIEAGKIETRTEDFDVYELIMEAAEMVKKDAQGKGLEFTAASEHIVLHTDRRRLMQCVINLMSNAVKFTERGSVSVQARLVVSDQGLGIGEKEPTPNLQSTAPSRDFVEISAKDTGIGIKEDDIHRLFPSFVRLESPLKAKIPGTGLGLYLTKKIVTEVLKGDIIATSIYGEGSTFTLLIPITKSGTVEKSTDNRGQ